MKKYFSFKGKINNIEFAKYLVILTIIQFIIFFSINFFKLSGLLLGACIILTIISVISQISLIIKRLHDINKPWWILLIVFIVNIIVCIGAEHYFHDSGMALQSYITQHVGNLDNIHLMYFKYQILNYLSFLIFPIFYLYLCIKKTKKQSHEST